MNEFSMGDNVLNIDGSQIFEESFLQVQDSSEGENIGWCNMIYSNR